MQTRLTLATRVFLASGLGVLGVLMLSTAFVGIRLKRELTAWEREQLAGFAHHAAEMVEQESKASPAQTVGEIASGLAPFGVSLSFALEPPEPGAAQVIVPLSAGRGFVVASAEAGPAQTLQRRLLRGWLLVGAGVLGALLIAVRLSIHWGFVRPLAQLERQLRRMATGGWGRDRAVAAGPELEQLSESIGAMGATVESNMRQWLAAERLASAERARVVIRRDALKVQRRLNLYASQLLAARGLAPDEKRALRRFLDAHSELGAILRGQGTPVDSEQEALDRLELLPPIAGRRGPKEEGSGGD